MTGDSVELTGYLLWASATGISSLYHVSLESLNILKNWHQSFRFPDASENCSALILRTTCGAKGAKRWVVRHRALAAALGTASLHPYCCSGLWAPGVCQHCNTAFPGKVSELHWDKEMGYKWYKYAQQCSTAIPSEAWPEGRQKTTLEYWRKYSSTEVGIYHGYPYFARVLIPVRVSPGSFNPRIMPSLIQCHKESN